MVLSRAVGDGEDGGLRARAAPAPLRRVLAPPRHRRRRARRGAGGGPARAAAGPRLRGRSVRRGPGPPVPRLPGPVHPAAGRADAAVADASAGRGRPRGAPHQPPGRALSRRRGPRAHPRDHARRVRPVLRHRSHGGNAPARADVGARAHGRRRGAVHHRPLARLSRPRQRHRPDERRHPRLHRADRRAAERRLPHHAGGRARGVPASAPDPQAGQAPDAAGGRARRQRAGRHPLAGLRDGVHHRRAGGEHRPPYLAQERAGRAAAFRPTSCRR